MNVRTNEQGSYPAAITKNSRARACWSNFCANMNSAVVEAAGTEDCLIHETEYKPGLRLSYACYCTSVEQSEKISASLAEHLRESGYNVKAMPRISMMTLSETLFAGQDGEQPLIGFAEFHFHLQRGMQVR